MTDSAVPDPDRFELISAYVDGEATDEEVARVEADADLLARADELAALRERLAAPAAPAGLVDTHVAAALDVMTVDGSAATAASVTSLGEHRARRLLARVPVLAAAAVVVVVAIAGALAARDLGGNSSSSDETAAMAVTSTTLATPDAGGSVFDSNAAGTDEATLAPAPGTARPAFSSMEDFAAFVGARDRTAEPEADTATGAAPTTTIPTAGPPTDPCDAVSVAGVDPAAVDAVVPATVAGRPVTGVVVQTAGDQPRLLVVDDATCTVVDERPL